jgi:hypothetical protein
MTREGFGATVINRRPQRRRRAATPDVPPGYGRSMIGDCLPVRGQCRDNVYNYDAGGSKKAATSALTMSGVEIMNRDDINLRTLLEEEFDLSDQSIETFLEKLRTSYHLQGLIFFCPSYPGRRASKGTIPPLRGRHDAEKSSWLSSLRRMTGVAWSQTHRKNAPLPFVLVGAGGSRQFVSIPVHAPNGVWTFLIATSNESDAEWEARRDKRVRDLKHIAHRHGPADGGTPGLCHEF